MNPADAAQAMPVAEITMFGLFWQAHFVVKVVMLGLLGSSIWCWSIIIDKTLLFRRTKAEMDAFEEEFWSGRPLEELFRAYNDKPATGLAALFVAAMREWRRSYEGSGRSIRSLGQRIDKVLDVTIQREVERLESRLLFLASIGSAGPYIGLFGTVFGIMTAFTSIAASKNTSLAVVAPGIAEALFATAIGLFAAIPAVLAYNKLQASVAKSQGRLEGFADEFSAILSRQIDERMALAA
ncbi:MULTISPECIES: protein TolQ [Methylobacterium]|jgi:biopolymer transport protein TolQ|uniref:Tol-Pal system protein TolQ n=1 Tax=Methylobacterium currus TaxID=2051553 RepID=A0A2R4WLU8_9HYPH|nr:MULTISPECIES: protein TolQ [Methylobacterium]AWB22522.1 protein TolQ [Methylobacterium currus]AWN50759.1 protein TolQ [Methylobacterium sp. 17Sr1-1]UHC17756.1 protein TolQ [Methylobacterium currus]